LNKRQQKKQNKKADRASALLMADKPKTKQEVKDFAEIHNAMKSIVYVPSNEEEERMLKKHKVPYLKEWRECNKNPEEFIRLHPNAFDRARIKIN